jgi:hypothetical protein
MREGRSGTSPLWVPRGTSQCAKYPWANSAYTLSRTRVCLSQAAEYLARDQSREKGPSYKGMALSLSQMPLRDVHPDLRLGPPLSTHPDRPVSWNTLRGIHALDLRGAPRSAYTSLHRAGQRFEYPQRRRRGAGCHEGASSGCCTRPAQREPSTSLYDGDHGTTTQRSACRNELTGIIAFLW